MGDRVPFVVGLLAIVAVVAVLVLRGEDAQPEANPPPVPATQKTATPPQPELPKSAPEPQLPPDNQPPPGPTTDETFAKETRDTAWATSTEAEIKKRWTQVRGGKLESLECRQTQCRLVVVGSETDVATSVADLEGPRGMHGFAQSVLLSGPQKNGDVISLRIFVRFER